MSNNSFSYLPNYLFSTYQPGEHVVFVPDPLMPQLASNLSTSTSDLLRLAIKSAKQVVNTWDEDSKGGRQRQLFSLSDEIRRLEGATLSSPEATIESLFEHSFWYAGWADKIDNILRSTMPTSLSPYVRSETSPIGTVGVLCPNDPTGFGLLHSILPPLLVGNSVIAVIDQNYVSRFIYELITAFYNAHLCKGIVSFIFIPALSKDFTLFKELTLNAEIEGWYIHNNTDPVYSIIGDSSFGRPISIEDSTRDYSVLSSASPLHCLPFCKVKYIWTDRPTTVLP